LEERRSLFGDRRPGFSVHFTGYFMKEGKEREKKKKKGGQWASIQPTLLG
jgi:hypothetical protein